MAEIRIRSTNERISGEDNVRAFLEQQEVLYEHWSPAKLPAELDNKFVKIRRSSKHKHNQIFYYTNKTLSQAHTPYRSIAPLERVFLYERLYKSHV